MFSTISTCPIEVVFNKKYLPYLPGPLGTVPCPLYSVFWPTVLPAFLEVCLSWVHKVGPCPRLIAHQVLLGNSWQLQIPFYLLCYVFWSTTLSEFLEACWHQEQQDPSFPNHLSAKSLSSTPKSETLHPVLWASFLRT